MTFDPQETDDASAGTCSSESRIRVLIVDDEPGMRRTLSRVLRAYGFDVKSAEDGEQGIDVAESFQPDCILMDVRMPGLSGVKSFERIKAIAPNAFTIFMSAYCPEELIEDVARLGANEVLAKPLNLEFVAELIKIQASHVPVLIVDDDANFCGSLQRVLSTLGCQVRVAESVDIGKELFESCPRGTVILDIRMHQHLGTETITEIFKRNERMAVIVVSGQPELFSLICPSEYIERVQCLPKPVDIDALIPLIGLYP